jgi:hypothetical protein
VTTEVFQIAPETVLVQGYEISGDNAGWQGLRFSHKRTRVVNDEIRGLHLKVPFKYLGNTRNPVRFWRVYPRAKVGAEWLGRRVQQVSIVAASERSPPWEIQVTFDTPNEGLASC